MMVEAVDRNGSRIAVGATGLDGTPGRQATRRKKEHLTRKSSLYFKFPSYSIRITSVMSGPQQFDALNKSRFKAYILL